MNIKISCNSPMKQAGVIVGIDYVIWLVGSVILTIYLFEGIMYDLSQFGYDLHLALERGIDGFGANLNGDAALMCGDENQIVAQIPGGNEGTNALANGATVCKTTPYVATAT